MEEKQKILIADDERINRKILSELLEEDHEVIIAKDGNQVIKRVENSDDIDLIILDIIMPNLDGYEVLKRLKESDNTKDIPVIFITGLRSMDDEEKGLKLGATDYIIKPFHPSIVKLRVENHLKFVRQRKLLENLVGRDSLTEIYNRRRFDEILTKEWGRAIRSNKPLSLIMIDVDYFKKYNDHYGHASGDVILKTVAKTIFDTLRRPADVVARYGGEEFVVILPETNIDGGKIIGEKIRAAVASLNIPHEKSEIADFISISLGGATISDNDLDENLLLKSADDMLYQAKGLGRNQLFWREL